MSPCSIQKIKFEFLQEKATSYLLNVPIDAQQVRIKSKQKLGWDFLIQFSNPMIYFCNLTCLVRRPLISVSVEISKVYAIRLQRDIKMRQLELVDPITPVKKIINYMNLKVLVPLFLRLM